MKLGVSYSVFSGIELLPFAIQQIRENVDFILVSFQEYDWFGKNKFSKEDYEILLKLKNNKLIDEINLFKINKYATNPIEAKLLEREKRNQSKNICIENGCDYYIDADVDEFYKNIEFKKAKRFLENNIINYSFVRIIEYISPITKRKKLSESYLPFICKIDKTLGTNNLNLNIDPTRGYILNSNDKYGIFNDKDILMHHMSFVRKNLKLKFETTSQATLNKNKIDNIIEDLKKEDLELVENYFGIKI